ncbi:MAG: hypothetical protein Kow0099_21460 [Candidatus Abyssubacteria bacterium]
MKSTRQFLPLLLAAIMLAVFIMPGMAQGDPLEDLNTWYYPYTQDELEKWYYGWYIRGGVTYYDVDGDEGRFREDRFIDDQLTGGVERFSYNQQNWSVSVTAVLEDLYGARVHYIKPEVFRVDFEFDRHRKYYDRQSEPWDPTLYGFTEGFAKDNDDDLFADRVDLNLEGQLLLPDIPNIILGWHHWERFGDEALLRGQLTTSTIPGTPFARSLFVINDVDGKSDTLYIEIPLTIEEKYNFRFRQEYEDYRDDQEAVDTTYTGGVPGPTQVFDDEPEWREFRTLFTFDSFITEGLFLSANYYHSDLENEFQRDVLNPGSPVNTFDDSDVENDLVSDAVTLGLVCLNLAENFTVSTNFRAERIDVNSHSEGLTSGTPIIFASSDEETRYGESVELIWAGLPGTTLSAAAEWEQRYWEREEVDGEEAANVLTRDVDIDGKFQEYTLTAVNRPHTDVRLTARYRFKDHDEDYDSKFDIAPTTYPDILGDLEDDKTHEVTFKGDWQFLPAWTLTAKYQFEDGEIEWDRQDTEGQDLRIHRVAGTIFGSPFDRVVLTGMAMYEDFSLDTPTNIPPGNQWFDGEGAYDFTYESYVLFGSGTYVINDKWSTNLSYQHTQNTGKDVDNDLDEVWVGAEYKLTEDKIISARYEFFDYDDDLTGFDDYDGHGVYLALAYRF